VGERAWEVRWAWWKVIWKSSRDAGIILRKIAAHATVSMPSGPSPSSILAKR